MGQNAIFMQGFNKGELLVSSCFLKKYKKVRLVLRHYTLVEFEGDINVVKGFLSYIYVVLWI
jgi:hypothetical protein